MKKLRHCQICHPVNCVGIYIGLLLAIPDADALVDPGIDAHYKAVFCLFTVSRAQQIWHRMDSD